MRLLPALLLVSFPLMAQTPCPCDPAKPETMKERQCSLCVEAEKQPDDDGVFFLKDINPRKPNRWLALPRTHTHGLHPLSSLSAEQRTRLWSAAIERAKQMWGKIGPSPTTATASARSATLICTWANCCPVWKLPILSW
jgi:hypothetical protein